MHWFIWLYTYQSLLIVNAGPGVVCNGTNFSDLFECCTEEHQCELYQGDCATDSQCKGNLKCGIKNCKLTSNITSYAGHWQEFNCCYNGMSIRKKIIVKLSTILLFFLLRTKIFELPCGQFRWLDCGRMWTSRLPMHVQENWYVKLYFSSLQEFCVWNENKTSLVMKSFISKLLLYVCKIFENCSW